MKIWLKFAFLFLFSFFFFFPFFSSTIFMDDSRNHQLWWFFKHLLLDSLWLKGHFSNQSRLSGQRKKSQPAISWKVILRDHSLASKQMTLSGGSLERLLWEESEAWATCQIEFGKLIGLAGWKKQPKKTLLLVLLPNWDWQLRLNGMAVGLPHCDAQLEEIFFLVLLLKIFFSSSNCSTAHEIAPWELGDRSHDVWFNRVFAGSCVSAVKEADHAVWVHQAGCQLPATEASPLWAPDKENGDPFLLQGAAKKGHQGGHWEKSVLTFWVFCSFVCLWFH